MGSIWKKSRDNWNYTGSCFICNGILKSSSPPPAAASAIVAINTQAGWGFLLTIIVSSLLLITISVLYNNLFQNRQYPIQW
ncbi:HPP family protein [Halalkalibacter lacteus]|uniref:HPP family protein n=1 Tax=Halalkalibacter lacteus TaxID=3090663 RepID=UPI002FCB79CC